MRIFIGILISVFSLCSHATDTVIGVTLITGNMQTVTIRSSVDTAIYSKCANLTPYVYEWHVSDVAHVSVNSGASAWTLNDLTTAAIAVCIVRTVI